MTVQRSGQLQSGTVTGGNTVLIELTAHEFGVLRRLIIKQTTGTLEGYALRVYDRKDAVSPSGMTTTTTINPNDNRQLLDPDCHQILPEQTIAAAADLFELYEGDYAYENQDELSVNGVARGGSIYLELALTGTGSKTFDIAWTTDIDFA